MNDAMKIKKLTAESESWFIRFDDARENLEYAQKELAVEKKNNDEAWRIAEDQKHRLDLITRLQKVSDETGYKTSWHMGGVTAECLQDEIKKAEAYERPIYYGKTELEFTRPPMKNTREIRRYIEVLEQSIRDFWEQKK
jgi:hypothetical protein